MPSHAFEAPGMSCEPRTPGGRSALSLPVIAAGPDGAVRVLDQLLGHRIAQVDIGQDAVAHQLLLEVIRIDAEAQEAVLHVVGGHVIAVIVVPHRGGRLRDPV
jgi:hypothetical protein